MSLHTICNFFLQFPFRSFAILPLVGNYIYLCLSYVLSELVPVSVSLSTLF